ncbi:hypothetical protein [Streptomyces sp. BK79]|uniref:hypothetical protein n=1 Tax=Streptomyces sp. BK79 TaxID=3350097 RepID=UPI0037705440
MSESTTQSATELASQYSVQVSDDLERNVKEQERVSAEITALQQQLAALQHDHALLVNMQQALGLAPAPALQATAAQPAADAATVPAPRGGAATEADAGKRSRSRKTTGASKRAAAPKSGARQASKAATKPTTAKPAGKPATTKPADKAAAKSPSAKAPAAKSPAADAPAAKAPAKAAGKPAAKKASTRSASARQATAQPTLVELVRAHLGEQSEPRSAAEVATALGAAHPGRNVKTTVVRTTLEGLVAKNQAQRSKQGTSVYYTATDAPAAKPAQDTGAETPAAKSDA